MLYFKVKKEFDQKRRKDNSILIQNELYTKKELEKFEIPLNRVDTIEISKKDIYFFFGARFN